MERYNSRGLCVCMEKTVVLLWNQMERFFPTVTVYLTRSMVLVCSSGKNEEFNLLQKNFQWKGPFNPIGFLIITTDFSTRKESAVNWAVNWAVN